VFWTNPSVNALSGDEDPIAVITENARDLVFQAIEDGWLGPSFDPFWFTEYPHLAVTPKDDIPDARLRPESSIGARIEFTPNQPKARVSFSLAHEIRHTFFPGFGMTILNRVNISKRDSLDEAQKFRAMISEEQPHRKQPL
jgi:hypothetical protein